MNRKSACVAMLMLMLANCPTIHGSETAEFVELIGGGSQLCCEFSFSPFTHASFESMTDGSTGTGFTYTSVRGNPFPEQTFGILKLFVFDVSRIQNITKIDISWTGAYEWSPGAVNAYPEMRLGVTPYFDFIGVYGFASGGMSTGNVVTGTRSFTGSSLANMISGPLATAWIATGFGSTTNSDFGFVSVTTLEVTAKVTGIRVAEPTTFGLVFLSLFGLSYRPLRTGRGGSKGEVRRGHTAFQKSRTPHLPFPTIR